jgi:hypothetical protein
VTPPRHARFPVAFELGERLNAVNTWDEAWGGVNAALGAGDPVGTLMNHSVIDFYEPPKAKVRYLRLV